MAIVTALTVPLAQLILRNMLIAKVGLIAAGHWQGLMRISDGYLMIVTTSLATYYLPRLASLKTKKELSSEIFKVYRLVIPAMLLGSIIIYLLRIFIIRLLYTADFLAMEHLFLWQLVGDCFRVAAWLLLYLMLAKAITRLYIITEVCGSVSYIILGYVLVGRYGVEGITMAFALNNVICFFFLVMVFRKLLFTHVVL